jgi:hypothetical protein
MIYRSNSLLNDIERVATTYLLRNTLADNPIIVDHTRYEDSKEQSLLMIILSLIFLNHEIIDEGN